MICSKCKKEVKVLRLDEGLWVCDDCYFEKEDNDIKE